MRRTNASPRYSVWPWNIAEEVKAQLADLAERGTRFVIAVASLNIS